MEHFLLPEVVMLFLPPWQSFEEPRCDLWENLLRSGCGEANIVYTRGEMRTQQVSACLAASQGPHHSQWPLWPLASS